MAKGKQGQLKLVPGNKRKQLRSGVARPVPVQITIDDQLTVKGLLVEVNFGKITLSVAINEPLEKLKKLQDLIISDGTSTIVDGKWKNIAVRKVEERYILTYEHRESKQLEVFKDIIGQEIILLHSRFKLFDLQFSDQDRQSFSEHLTEIKDFPIPLNCNLTVAAKSLLGSFDFTANLKTLSTLAFHLDLDQSDISTYIGKDILVRYEFLGVKYLFKAKIRDFESEFKLLYVDIPSLFLSSTARRYDRFPCHFSARLTSSRETQIAEIVDVSPCGATLRSHERMEFKGSDFTVYVEDPKVSFYARLLRVNENLLTLEFADDARTKKAAMTLVSRALPPKIEERKKINYSVFLKLYEDVGYGPVEKSKIDSWHLSSSKAWEYQDSRYPGGCTGSYSGNSLIAAFGIHPFSRNVAYAHSLCMIKTVESAGAMLSLMTHSLSWTEFFTDAHFYAGSYAKSSKFTTRIHSLFTNQPTPKRQKLIDVIRFFPNFFGSSKAKSSYKLRETPRLNLGYDAAEDTKFIFSAISEPHFSIADVHKIEFYQILENDSVLATMVVHNAPDDFTAANVFQYVWLFTNDYSILANLIDFIRKETKFERRTIQLVVDQEFGKVSPEVGGVPAFWSFTPREELGPLVGSIYRSVYTVLRKYGDEGIDEISKSFVRP